MRERPPRVLRLITRLNIGGPARQALLLTRELAAEYPTLLAAGRPPESEGEMTDDAVTVRPVPLVRELRPQVDVRAFAAVRSLLREEQPQIIHTHMAKAGAIGRMAAATVRPRPRTVHTFHGHVLEGYFPPPLRAAFLTAERLYAHRTDALVAVSPQIRDELYDLGIGREDQWRVIPLGFELDGLLRVDQPAGVLRRHVGVPQGVPLVGMLGRLAPVKDHAMALHAMTHVDAAHLLILGDGALRGDLERLRDDLGLHDRVHFVGWWKDVATALSDIDVVLLTSRNEGTPVSLIEAHAAGRTAVATNVGGVESVVIDGRTGYLVAPCDAFATAARLNHLLRDRQLRERFGDAGREHAREHFTHVRLLSEVTQLYDDLLGK